jgi:NAD(P)-dependent dehydrogenase (short-subunit alcohol dehydrogenase family)
VSGLFVIIILMKTILITGSTSGLGLALAKHLAPTCRVVITGRTQERLDKAKVSIGNSPNVVDLTLDISDLDDVKRFVEVYIQEIGACDVLINNAGIMATPYQLSKQGFEMQMATNHIGHAALSLGLINQLGSQAPKKIIHQSSLYALQAKRSSLSLIPPEEPTYNTWEVYANSKLANQLFARGLARFAKSQKLTLDSIAVHPGYANTELQLVGPSLAKNQLLKGLMAFSNNWFAQSPEDGILPTLAALEKDALAETQLWGPAFLQWRGPAKQYPMASLALDDALVDQFWSDTLEAIGYH